MGSKLLARADGRSHVEASAMSFPALASKAISCSYVSSFSMLSVIETLFVRAARMRRMSKTKVGEEKRSF
jgi:hypothetical protein